jgi:lysophospholipase L1-like esterase
MTRVLQCARDADLEALDILEKFEEAGVSRNPDAYYSDDFHFNAMGQALAAKSIAAGLCGQC